jgi:hypothetical protein
MSRKASPLLILLLTIALSGCGAFCKPDRSSTDGSPSVRSLNSNTPALMTFVNQSDQPVDIYWIDFGGRRQLYKTLEAGGSYTQQTYLTHPWLIADAGGQSWNVYLPEAQPRTVYLQAPNNAAIAR